MILQVTFVLFILPGFGAELPRHSSVTHLYLYNSNLQKRHQQPTLVPFAGNLSGEKYNIYEGIVSGKLTAIKTGARLLPGLLRGTNFSPTFFKSTESSFRQINFNYDIQA